MRIEKIKALQILDSRGNPTVRSFIFLENGIVAKASVPSGASTGSHEAVELRDGDESRFHGKGVLKAVENVNTEIAKALKGMDIQDLERVDKELIELDGTENKARLGANAILSVSLAAARALSLWQGRPLWQTLNEYYFSDTEPDFPRPMVNVINGGAHAGFNFDFQEYLILPKRGSFPENIRLASEIFQEIKKILQSRRLSVLVGDEGGFSPDLADNEEPFKLILQAAENLGYENERDFQLGIDAAATEFFQEGRYSLRKQGKIFTRQELLEFYKNLIERYDLFSFEDPFAEDDWSGFSEFVQAFPDRVVIGDDLFVTNIKRLQKGIKLKAANAILIKLNQIGSLYETVQTIREAKKAGFRIAVSHRSGETEDDFIADLSFACAADFIKTGSTCRSERVAKYNRLLEIEEEVN